QVAGQPLDFVTECADIERGLARQSGYSLDLKRRVGRGRFVSRKQRRAAKVLTQQTCESRCQTRSSTSQAVRQLVQTSLELRDLTFERKRILPRRQLREERLHRVRYRQGGCLIA